GKLGRTNMKTLAAPLAAVVLLLGGVDSIGAPQDDVAKKLTETYASAADWMVSQQDASGAWKQTAGDKMVPSPSFTGLVVTALGGAPASLKEKYKPAVDKGLAYLLSKINADGSVGEG